MIKRFNEENYMTNILTVTRVNKNIVAIKDAFEMVQYQNNAVLGNEEDCINFMIAVEHNEEYEVYVLDVELYEKANFMSTDEEFSILSSVEDGEKIAVGIMFKKDFFEKELEEKIKND